MMQINLAPTRHVEAIRVKRRIRLWSGVCSVYGAMLLAAYGAVAAGYRQADPVAVELSTTQSRIESVRAEGSTYKGRVAAAHRNIDAARAVGEHPDWSLLLVALDSVRGDIAVFEGVRLTTEGDAADSSGRNRWYELRITGYAASQRDVSTVVLGLEQLGAPEQIFDSVQLIETRRRAFGEKELVGFEVLGTLREHRKAGSK